MPPELAFQQTMTNPAFLLPALLMLWALERLRARLVRRFPR